MEKEVKPTNGPWEIICHGSRPSIETVNKKRGMRATGDKYPLICYLPDGSAPSLGNAKLIAMAPDMLSILKGILDGNDIIHQDIRSLVDYIESDLPRISNI
jgi:hypothetical protein